MTSLFKYSINYLAEREMKTTIGNGYRWRGKGLGSKMRLLLLVEDPLEGQGVLHIKLLFILHDST